jgi:hypothetical protein
MAFRAPTGRQDGREGEVGEWLGVVAAAARSGVTPDAIRRRIRRKTLRAERVPAENGGTPPYRAWVAAGEPGGASPGSNGALGGRQEPRQKGAVVLATARAEEMARYSATLLAPLHAHLKELSRENGRLEERAEHLQAELERRDAELEQARAQLLERVEATAPKEPPETESAPPVGTWPAGRPWGPPARWRWG